MGFGGGDGGDMYGVRAEGKLELFLSDDLENIMDDTADLKAIEKLDDLGKGTYNIRIIGGGEDYTELALSIGQVRRVINSTEERLADGGKAYIKKY